MCKRIFIVSRSFLYRWKHKLNQKRSVRTFISGTRNRGFGRLFLTDSCEIGKNKCSHPWGILILSSYHFGDKTWLELYPMTIQYVYWLVLLRLHSIFQPTCIYVSLCEQQVLNYFAKVNDIINYLTSLLLQFIPCPLKLQSHSQHRCLKSPSTQAFTFASLLLPSYFHLRHYQVYVFLSI